LLLPAKLRESKTTPSCIISLFLHTPFPSPELWRVLPYRNLLLEGMLAANVVGFHLFEYARHFMTACRRLLGLGENVGVGPAGGVLSINLGARLVTITVSHVGIDRDVMLHRLKQGELAAAVQAMRQRCDIAGRKVIGGIEMLNPLQGAALKLDAFEALLTDYPMWRSRLTMVQVCFADAARPEASQKYSAEMRETATRIRSKFGENSLYYFEVGTELSAWTVQDRLALFRVCDVYLNCAMRDGLNLLPFEYVLTKSTQQPPSDGIAVLSEFVGCAHVLNGAMRINPFNLEHIVEQLDLALAMSPEERAARLAKDYDFVRSHSTSTWLKVAVQDMRRVRSAMLSATPVTQPTTSLAGWPGGTRKGDPLPRLHVESVCRAYRNSSRRVLFLGLDGTLIQQEKVLAHLKNFHDFQGHSLQPPAAALQGLAALAADPANVVYIISGRAPADMQATLGQVPSLGLAAELGYVQLMSTSSASSRLRLNPFAAADPSVHRVGSAASSLSQVSDDAPFGTRTEDDVTDDERSSPDSRRGGAAADRSGRGASASNWATLLHNLPPPAPDWRERAQQLIREYTTRTNGSYERTQRSAVQWCYHDADPDFGRLQAQALTVQLRAKLADAGVTVSHHHVKGMVEARLTGVNKGAAADVLLMAADRQAPVDFLLCIGDDDDDEYMLSATTARACSPGLRERLQGKLFTVSVGNRPTSHAQYVASSSKQVLSLLEALRGASGSPAMPGGAMPGSPRDPTHHSAPPPSSSAAVEPHARPAGMPEVSLDASSVESALTGRSAPSPSSKLGRHSSM